MKNLREKELCNNEDVVVLKTMIKAMKSDRYWVATKLGVVSGIIYTMGPNNKKSWPYTPDKDAINVSLAQGCFGPGKSHIKVWGESKEKILAFAKYCGFEYEKEEEEFAVDECNDLPF